MDHTVDVFFSWLVPMHYRYLARDERQAIKKAVAKYGEESSLDLFLDLPIPNQLRLLLWLADTRSGTLYELKSEFNAHPLGFYLTDEQFRGALLCARFVIINGLWERGWSRGPRHCE